MDAKNLNNESLNTGSSETFITRKISRLDFLKQISMLIGFVAVGCSPVRVLLKAYPKKFDADTLLVDQILRAFVVTVIPGAPDDDPNLTRIYSDEYYPFHSYCGFFVSDLSRRSADLYGDDRFDRLSAEQRTNVIEDGLRADATVARLYRAAIFMAQVSFYAGIYDDEKGCPLIDFHGSNSGFTLDEMCYPDCSSLLAHECTKYGNYV